MNRKEFLKLIGNATARHPFCSMVLLPETMNQFLDFPVSCDGVNDRVMVIMRFTELMTA